MTNAENRRTLLLFRHGQTSWNHQGRIQGHLDVPLNATGRRQARALGSHLERLGVEIILSSDLCRAWETAELASRGRIRIVREPRLRETFLGMLQGLTKEELNATHPAANRESRFPYLTDEAVQGLGGEQAEQVRERAVTAVEEFLARTPHRIVGVSSHGGVIRRLIQHALEAGELPPPIPNSVLYPLEIDLATRRWRLVASLPHLR